MKKKPRILFITTSFPTNANKGSGIFVFRLIDQLTKWVNASVLTPDTTPNNKFRAGSLHLIPTRYAPRKYQTLAHSPGGIPETIKYHPLHYISLITLLVSLFINILKHGRHSQLIHSNWSISGLIGGAAAKLIGRPAIMTLRGADVNRAKHKWLDRAILRIAIKLNDRIVCVSQSQREWLLINFPGTQTKTHHIANGVLTPVLADACPETTSTDSCKTLKLVSVGSLIKRKGFAHIIQTIASLPSASGITLTIIGDGPIYSELHDLAEKLSLSSSITLLGCIAPDNIPEFLSKYDAFILCSYSEGRSNALLEAMASAMPIIATDIAGTNELISDNENGILIPCDDSKALRNAMLRLRDNPGLRKSYGLSALQSIVDLELTWDRTANDYLDLYMALIKQES